jgi:anti-sigma regulatory factor (Ser/Thr protein kinase)
VRGTAISATSYTGVFRGEPDQVSQARREVARYLKGCPAAEDAELVISELVTDAVLYSGSRHGMLTVRSERYPRYAWLEVTDAGGDWQPGSDSDGGRGLAIVAAVAAEWGVDGDARGRTIWARLEW